MSKHLCAELKTNILSVKNYKYVRFPIFLTGMWKVSSTKKNFLTFFEFVDKNAEKWLEEMGEDFYKEEMIKRKEALRGDMKE